MMRRDTLLDAAIAFSLANLCFIATWRQLLFPRVHAYQTAVPPPPWTYYVAALCGVTFLAALFWGGATVARRWGGRWLRLAAKGAFLVVLLIALNGLRLQLRLNLPGVTFLLEFLGQGAFFALLFLLAGGGLFLVARAGRTMKLARGLALAFFPFVLLTFAQSVGRSLGPREVLADNTPATTTPQGKRPPARVLWIIFDEWGYRESFSERPASVRLPEIDRLVAGAFVANQAFPPSDATLKSMPALLTGKLVADAQPQNANDILLTFAGNDAPAPWSTHPTIFSQMQAAGYDTAVAGWSHPYCRVIGGSLTHCVWEPSNEEWLGQKQEVTFRQRLSDDASRLLAIAPFAKRFIFDPQRLRRHAQGYENLVSQAEAMATTPGLALTLAHLPVPHAPHIYDRTKADWDFTAKGNYYDSLVLADRTLGRLRQALEQAGEWEQTILVVSADHWWRSPYRVENQATEATRPEKRIPRADIDYRVPFIIKLPGQTQRFSYEPGFNTVLSHDLILALVKDELKTPGDIAVWLDAKRGTVREQPVLTGEKDSGDE